MMMKSIPNLFLQMAQETINPSSCTKSVKSKNSKKELINSSYESSSCKSQDIKINDDVSGHPYENVESRNGQYENTICNGNSSEVIYDFPQTIKMVVNHYESNDLYPVYENIGNNEPTYLNIQSPKSAEIEDESHHINNNQPVYANTENMERPHRSKSRKSSKHVKNINITTSDPNLTYDVPKTVTQIYDIPMKQTRKVHPKITTVQDENTYDTPMNNRSIIPLSSTIHRKSKTEQIKKIEDIFADCEKDSVNGESERDIESPDIPPPDYGSEEEDIIHNRKDRSDVTVTAVYIDEGLGNYYADDQGLEIILEEPEEDYVNSHSSDDELRRRRELQRCRKLLTSPYGSEALGSTEDREDGYTRSSERSSERCVEENCNGSAINTEGTPAPSSPSEVVINSVRSPPAPCFEEKEVSMKKCDTTQKDRCIEVYPETLRQRQRNTVQSPSKVTIKNWEIYSASNDEGKKLLPSVKALRNQFEMGKTASEPTTPSKAPMSLNSSPVSSIGTSSAPSSLTSPPSSITSTITKDLPNTPGEPVEPIFHQFKPIDEELKELMSKSLSTQGWNPHNLLNALYYVPDAPKIYGRRTPPVSIEGYMEKLPSGRKKATFWNAWKRRYFVAKDGVLYCYPNDQTEKASVKLSLVGGKIEVMDASVVNDDDGERDTRSVGMLGVDDGKGHYLVLRCVSKQEAERWKIALETHTVDDFCSQYVQPWPRPSNPTLLRDTLVIDIGSCSVRAGVLASQPTLPQLFFPSVVATHRETKNQVWGIEALMPDVRSTSTISFPIRPSHKISKFSVDLHAFSSLLQKTFTSLKVDPKNYNIQLSVPRILNPDTQKELLQIMFNKFNVKSVNMTHQSILALYAYNSTSGVVVDIGERLDVVPVIDGYIVDGGVSRVPYGGCQIMDHLRQFLFEKNISLINEVDSYVIRQVLETICYCAEHYNTEKQRCTMDTKKYLKSVCLEEYFPDIAQFRDISLDFGRFQTTEGLFNPDAWGLDHQGLHKLVNKAIQECSMDIRKEMSRSIFLAGGVTQLPGLMERLTNELDNLTPPAIKPKVHASPYRYHAAFLGACQLAESSSFHQSKITKEEWVKQGISTLRKWSH